MHSCFKYLNAPNFIITSLSISLPLFLTFQELTNEFDIEMVDPRLIDSASSSINLIIYGTERATIKNSIKLILEI